MIVRLRHFAATERLDHTASCCSPTRSMIMSGTDNHIAGVGIMYEYKSLDPERWNLPGHEGYLSKLASFNLAP